MKRVISELWSIMIAIVLVGSIGFLIIILYNNNVTEDKRLTLENIKNSIKSSNEIDPFDLVDEPVINDKLEKNYFYAQLDEIGKIIYTSLDENKINMKTGTYKIDLGTVFTNTLKLENGKEILGDSYQSAIEAYIYDNPDVFYLNVNNMYLNIQKTTKGEKVKYEVFIDQGTNESYLADEYENQQQIESCEAEIEQITTNIISNLSGNNYEKILKLHNYLVENIEYDQTLKKKNIYNIYGALVKNECVCEGYAKSLKYLANKAGINCVIVTGTGTNSKGQQENHAWNYVQLNGLWYAIDVTWDDPIIIGNGKLSKESKYKYFLKSKNNISKDHIESGKITSDGKEFEYPVLSESDYIK